SCTPTVWGSSRSAVPGRTWVTPRKRFAKWRNRSRRSRASFATSPTSWVPLSSVRPVQLSSRHRLTGTRRHDLAGASGERDLPPDASSEDHLRGAPSGGPVDQSAIGGGAPGDHDELPGASPDP